MPESDPGPARETLAEDPPGGRPYPPEPVAKRAQGARSPGQSEPGDMGAFDTTTGAQPRHESPSGNGAWGYRGA
ncbi:hypothetical protein ACLBX9_21085 [Methylobacterium sp. A49B]